MTVNWIKKHWMPSILLTLLICALAGGALLYMFSSPVLLVSDSVFEALYGRRRALVKQAGFFARFLRPVKTVLVAEGAGPDIVSLAVQQASKKPFSVFFPYRYKEGAQRYLQDHPGIPAAVLAGRMKRGGEGPAWFSTDTLTDLYRAGFSAGIIGQNRTNARDILVFHNGLDSGEQAAFTRGLMDLGGFSEDSVLFTGSGWEYAGETIACAVIVGQITSFFHENENPDDAVNLNTVPLVVFTWLDPAWLPSETALVFDDSPWEILPEAFVLLKRGETEAFIPSIVRSVPESGFLNTLKPPELSGENLIRALRRTEYR